MSKDRYSQGFPDGSSGKEPTCIAGDTEDTVRSLSQEDPLEKGIATCSSNLAEKNPKDRSLVGHGLWGCNKSDMTEVTEHTYTATVHPKGGGWETAAHEKET